MSNTPTASLGGETNGGDLERIKKLCPPTRMARHGICRRQIQQHIAMSLILVCLHGVEIALPEGIEKRFGTHRAMRRNLSGNPPRESRFHTIDGGFAGVAPSCVWLEGRGAERNRISRMRLQLRGGQDAQAAGPHPSNPSPLSSSCSCFSSVELPILCLPRFTYPTVAVLLPHIEELRALSGGKGGKEGGQEGSGEGAVSQVGSAICLRACYATPGTAIADDAVGLGKC
eukprot:629411-Rhodomonas_salina.1